MSVLLVLIAVLKGVFGLRLLRLDVPSAVILGNPVWLNCSYELEGDLLYSVKWYKNNVEFYRYLPSDKPPAQKYKLRGIYVDLLKSFEGDVFLSRTSHNTEGSYRCEVSSEAPSFKTVKETKDLRVYVLPQDGPRITGTRPQYRVSDRVNTTCEAGPSKPAASLKWFINGKAANEDSINHLPSVVTPEDLESSALRLTFDVKPHHFWKGMMKLRCTAVISQAYSMSSEEIIVGNYAKSTGAHYGDESDGPTITGGLPSYQVGDTVDVNCTSSKSKPAAELQWYLNDKKVSQGYIVLYPGIHHSDGQFSSVLGMRFTVRSDHFDRNEMRLKCTSTLSKVINTSNEETVLGSSQQSSLLHIYENSDAFTNAGKHSQHLVNVYLLSTILVYFTLLVSKPGLSLF